MKKEALDEVVLRCQQAITAHLRREQSTTSPSPLPPLPPTSEAAGAAEGASTTTPWPSRSAERVPFCAFNGGRDAWVDVGNKDIGVQAMQSFLKIKSRANCLHVGDQLNSSIGNDFAARLASQLVAARVAARVAACHSCEQADLCDCARARGTARDRDSWA